MNLLEGSVSLLYLQNRKQITAYPQLPEDLGSERIKWVIEEEKML